MTGPQQLPLAFEHRSALSGDDFLVADCNRAAVGWIDRWPDWPVPALALHGPVGCGKSHLAAVFREQSGAKPLLVETVSDGPNAAPAWVVDGVTDLLAAVGDEALLHFYNSAVEQGAQMLLVDRAPPARWQVALADLRSRLNAAAAVEIGPPDDPLLAAVLVKLFADRQLKIASSVVEYVLPRMERSFAAAGDLVDKLDRLALAERREITVPLARRVFEAG